MFKQMQTRISAQLSVYGELMLDLNVVRIPCREVVLVQIGQIGDLYVGLKEP